MTQALSAPLVSQTFPAGTADAPLSFTVSGNLADGTNFSLTQPSGTFDLPAGVFTGVVSKTVGGTTFSSQPSAPLTVAGPVTVTLEVPAATQPAVLA